MQQNLPEEGIGLEEIFHRLIKSKNTIIISTIIVTISAAIFAFQKPIIYSTSGLIEIGNHRIEGNERNTLIESSEKLISELKITFIHKDDLIMKKSAQSQNASNGQLMMGFNITLQPIEDRLVRVFTESQSIKSGSNLLNEITDYAINRHEVMINDAAQKSINKKIASIEQLDSAILLNKGLFKSQLENELSNTESKIASVKAKILNINEEIELYDNKRAADKITAARSKVVFQENKLSKVKFDIASAKTRIQNINEEIDYYTEREESDRVLKISQIENTLPFITKKIVLIKQLIIDEKANLALLADNPAIFLNRASVSPTLDQIISEYEKNLVDLNIEKSELTFQLIALNKQNTSNNNFLKQINLENDKRSNQSKLADLNRELAEINYDIGNISEKVYFNTDTKTIFDLVKRERTETIILGNLNKELSEIRYMIKNKNNVDNIYFDSNMAKNLFDLVKAKNSEEAHLKLLINKKPISTKIVSTPLSSKVSHKSLTIAIAFVLGLILGVFIVLIRYYLEIFKKTLKKN